MQRGLLAAILVVLVIIAVAVIAIAVRQPPPPPGFPTIDPTYNAQIDSTIQAVYATNTAVEALVRATQTAGAK